MNRAVVIVVTLLAVAGSVPAAATIADSAQTTESESDAEPGASFAGVVGVQQAEVNNEVAQRSLDRRFAAAASNDSKARVVAEQESTLRERLDELEAEKAQLERAQENGSISQGAYRARLAALAADVRAVERQANQTASVGESLPEQALRDRGANVSAVRAVAQDANRTGGGAVAEAARSVAGEGVGNGLRGPPNGSVGGPPDDAGPPGADDRNDSSNGGGNGQPDGVGPEDETETETPTP
ncbi:MAG: hypothetical protein ACOCSD_06090 [Halolamina sp.]